MRTFSISAGLVKLIHRITPTQPDSYLIPNILNSKGSIFNQMYGS